MDQMDIKVSVIMLTYNRERFVGHAIESILSQTMNEFEYIIVDNGSSDRSGEIADEYEKKIRELKYCIFPKAILEPEEIQAWMWQEDNILLLLMMMTRQNRTCWSSCMD